GFQCHVRVIPADTPSRLLELRHAHADDEYLLGHIYCSFVANSARPSVITNVPGRSPLSASKAYVSRASAEPLRQTRLMMVSFGNAGLLNRTARRLSLAGSSGLMQVMRACDVNARVHIP